MKYNTVYLYGRIVNTVLYSLWQDKSIDGHAVSLRR